jgi:hypothetical protein
LHFIKKLHKILLNDIEYNIIMDARKLAKIKKKISEARRGAANLKFKDLEKIAKMLGREQSKDRNNHPTFVSTLLDTNVITIPNHSAGVKKYTALNILDQFDNDVFELEFLIEQQENEIIYANEEFEN